MTKVIGYCRVSTREQGDSGAGLAAQRRRIKEEAERRGWQVEWKEDISSGKSLRRQGIQEALETIGEGDILVVTKLDRVSRSVADFAKLVERARAGGWQIVVVEQSFDMTTASGRLQANILAAFAEFERDMTGERTRAALAEKVAQGVTLGRPRVVERGAVECIACYAADGMGPREIARQLEATGVLAPRGGTVWHASTVSRILRGVAA